MQDGNRAVIGSGSPTRLQGNGTEVVEISTDSPSSIRNTSMCDPSIGDRNRNVSKFTTKFQWSWRVNTEAIQT